MGNALPLLPVDRLGTPGASSTCAPTQRCCRHGEGRTCCTHDKTHTLRNKNTEQIKSTFARNRPPKGQHRQKRNTKT